MLQLTPWQEESFDEQLFRSILVQWEQPCLLGGEQVIEQPLWGLLPSRVLPTEPETARFDRRAFLSEQAEADLLEQECPHARSQ